MTQFKNSTIARLKDLPNIEIDSNSSQVILFDWNEFIEARELYSELLLNLSSFKFIIPITPTPSLDFGGIVSLPLLNEKEESYEFSDNETQRINSWAGMSVYKKFSHSILVLGEEKLSLIHISEPTRPY